MTPKRRRARVRGTSSRACSVFDRTRIGATRLSEKRRKSRGSVKPSRLVYELADLLPIVGIKYRPGIVKHSTRGYNRLQMTLLMLAARCIYITTRVHSRRYNLYFLHRVRSRARKIRRSVSPTRELRAPTVTHARSVFLLSVTPSSTQFHRDPAKNTMEKGFPKDRKRIVVEGSIAS